jgi:molybdopterin biosynthesis enzyme MoaB
MLKTAYIIPTGDEILNGVVQDLDAPEIIGQIVRAYPEVEVTRLCPLIDKEDTIFNKIHEIAAQKKPDLIVLIGGSGGGHRFSSTLAKDFTHSALERYLDQGCSREIYGKNGHLWCKLICGKKGPTLIVNVPGPFQEAKAAMEACLKALAEEADVEDICKAMAEAVYAQYPVGAAKTL